MLLKQTQSETLLLAVVVKAWNFTKTDSGRDSVIAIYSKASMFMGKRQVLLKTGSVADFVADI